MEVLTLRTLHHHHLSGWTRGTRRLLLTSPLQQQLTESYGRQRLRSLKATVSLTNLGPKQSETELVLNQAQRDLAELCKIDEDLACWKALSYFAVKRQHLEQHCHLGKDVGENDPESCTSLISLEKFVREQMSAGSARNMCSNLIIMQRVEEQSMVGGRGDGHGQSPGIPVITDKELHAKACLVRLFHALDTDGDGEIGMLEFQDGMEALGATLTEDDMRQISEAEGNSKNRLDMDEFIEVMEASPVLHGVALGDDSNFLRHAAHTHGIHQHHTGRM